MVEHVLLPILVGLLGGFLGSLFGIGGGSLMTPLLVATGYDIKTVVPASLVAIVGTSISGLDVYARHNMVNYKIAFRIEPAAILGAIIASRIALELPGLVLKIVLFTVLIYIGIDMLRASRRVEEEKSYGVMTGVEPPPRLQVLGAIGKLGAGFLSALVGIGGGVVTVPVLRRILKFDMKEAIATAKLDVGITASGGAISYALLGVLNPCLALSLGVGTVIGAYIGALTGVRVSSRTLNILFSIFLFSIAVLMLVRR
ncbi:MAG: sulfite exporter TauE/SafE family protein [Desulfurococcales archaeon]|nr:sulfite exporter TauE/SafE family protein [Desulfurococcales archaeon]